MSVGGTTDDGTITLRKAECLGGCSWAPVVAVDERYRERVTPGDVRADRRRDPLRDGRATCLSGPRASRPTSCSTSTATCATSRAYEAYGGYAQLRRARAGMDAGHARSPSSAARPCAAAAAPASRPAARRASSPPARERYLVVNADESEPGSCKDRELMLRTPHALLEGILIVMNVLRLTRAYIYIRGEYLTESEVLEAAIAEARAARLRRRAPGPTATSPEITVHRGAGAYICGEETALLSSLNGFRGQPSAKPPFPAVSGAFERPTLLNNVETIATIPAILRRGAEDYKALGTEQSGGTHVMSISGHVLRPGQLRDAHEPDDGPPDRGARGRRARRPQRSRP